MGYSLANSSVRDLLAVGFIFLVAYGLTVVLGRALGRMAEANQLAPTMAARMRIGMRWVIVLGAMLMALQQTGVFHQAWAVLSAILAALAVGFVAMWSVLSNMTAAVLLLTYRPFRIGDELQVLEHNGQMSLDGVVLDLNLMYTTLRQGQDAVVRIPNNLLFQKYLRVRREGYAPDPTADGAEPFFRPTDPPA